MPEQSSRHKKTVQRSTTNNVYNLNRIEPNLQLNICQMNFHLLKIMINFRSVFLFARNVVTENNSSIQFYRLTDKAIL